MTNLAMGTAGVMLTKEASLQRRFFTSLRFVQNDKLDTVYGCCVADEGSIPANRDSSLHFVSFRMTNLVDD